MNGQKIAKLRLMAGYTQDQLAEQLFVSREMVSKWERNVCQPDYQMVLKISEVLEISSDEILTKENAILNELYSFLADINVPNLQEEINSFLATLKSRDRSIFVRRYYFLENISTISDYYNLKESNVRMILMRTRTKLRKYLEGQKNEKE